MNALYVKEYCLTCSGKIINNGKRNLFLSLGLGSNFGNESSSRVAWQEEHLKDK